MRSDKSRLMALALALFSGWPGGPAQASPPALDAQDRRELMEIVAETAPGIPLTLNLADPEEHGFLERRLSAAGLLAQNGYGADLRKVLAELADAQNLAAPSQHLTLLQMDALPGTWHPSGMINQLGRLGQSDEYYAAATLAVPDSLHGILILELFDNETWQPIGEPAVRDEWLGGSVSVGVRAASSSARVAALFTYLYIAKGQAPVAQVLRQEVTSPTPGQGIPAQAQFSSLLPCPKPQRDSQCSIGNPATNVKTEICLGRAVGLAGNPCDQAFDGEINPRLEVFGVISNLDESLASNWKPTNVKATLTTNSTCETAVLIFTAQGANSFDWKNPPDKKEITKDCLGSYETPNKTRDVQFNLNFKTYLSSKSDSGQPLSTEVQFTISSGELCIPTTNVACVNRLIVNWGCLPAGTPIRMADGSVKKIENIEVNERVLADAGGRSLEVVNTVRGTEKDPLVVVADDHGHTLSLTASHPVLTHRGVVQAEALQLDDELRTEEGATRIVRLERRTSERPAEVWNLDLGEAGARDDRDGNTFFAAGIQVGDYRMQGKYEEAARTLRPQDIPPELREDYRLWAAARQRQATASASPDGGDVPPHFRADYAEWVKARLAQRARP